MDSGLKSYSSMNNIAMTLCIYIYAILPWCEHIVDKYLGLVT